MPLESEKKVKARNLGLEHDVRLGDEKRRLLTKDCERTT